MKKIFTFLLGLASLYVVAQGPTIEGTYLPVKGTAVKQVWNTQPGTIPIPVADTGITWDYRGYFTNTSNTYKIATFAADTTPYFNHFNTVPDSATHASYLYSPLNNISDSLYSYYIVNRSEGLYMLGGRSEKDAPQLTGSSPILYMGNDTTYKITNTNPMRHGELYAPVNINYSSPQLYDTTYMVTYGAAYTGGQFPTTIPLKLREWKYKTFKVMGYGTIIMPDSTVYDNTLLALVTTIKVDSFFMASNNSFISQSVINFYGLGGYIQSPSIDTIYQYAFLRNNTFGSSYLMYLLGNDTIPGTASFVNGWYSLPVDCGSISGMVYTDEDADTLVTQGVNMAYLYRENSNFAKHDILAKDTIDTNGHYQFDNIPYGVYRVAIRADTSVYHRALTTYYGDTTDWITADTIVTFGDSLADGRDIHLQYYPDSLGSNHIEGTLTWNFNFFGDSGIHTFSSTDNDRQNNPIPGIDVVVRKQPGGSAFAEPITDSNGQFTLPNLPDGQYTLHVDIPGCPHATTYTFCVQGGEVLDSLNYQCGARYLHSLSQIDTTTTCNPITTSVADNQAESLVALQAYPNPYTSSTTVKINLAQVSDVTLEVYNLLGEKVQVLYSGVKQAGIYSYPYSASAINRPAGVYFVRLIANGKTSVLKIVEQ